MTAYSRFQFPSNRNPKGLDRGVRGTWLALYFGRPVTKGQLVFIILYFFNKGLDVLEMTDPERNALLDDEKSPSNNSGCNEDNACSSFTQCRVYKRRWYILFVFTMTSIVSNTMWNTWGPIQRPCRLVFGWERWTVLLLSSLGAIGPILGAFPSTWLMDSRGEPPALNLDSISIIKLKCLI